MFIVIDILVLALAIYLIADSVKNIIEIFKRSKYSSEEQLAVDENPDEK